MAPICDYIHLQISQDEFIMLQKLGAGAGGIVYKALHATSLW